MSEDVLDNLIRNQRALAKEYTFEEDGDRIEDSWHWKAADAIERLRARITELEDHPIWSSDHDQKYLELLAKKDRRIARLRSALERHAPDILDDLESVKSSGARR